MKNYANDPIDLVQMAFCLGRVSCRGILTKSKSKSKYHYVGKIVERHHANPKMVINKTILKYTK